MLCQTYNIRLTTYWHTSTIEVLYIACYILVIPSTIRSRQRRHLKTRIRNVEHRLTSGRYLLQGDAECIFLHIVKIHKRRHLYKLGIQSLFMSLLVIFENIPLFLHSGYTEVIHGDTISMSRCRYMTLPQLPAVQPRVGIGEYAMSKYYRYITLCILINIVINVE